MHRNNGINLSPLLSIPKFTFFTHNAYYLHGMKFELKMIPTKYCSRNSWSIVVRWMRDCIWKHSRVCSTRTRVDDQVAETEIGRDSLHYYWPAGIDKVTDFIPDLSGPSRIYNHKLTRGLPGQQLIVPKVAKMILPSNRKLATWQSLAPNWPQQRHDYTIRLW